MKLLKIFFSSAFLFLLSVSFAFAQGTCELNGEEIPCDQIPGGGLLILIPIVFGLIGLAMAFLIAFALQYLAFFIYFRKKFNLSMVFPTSLVIISAIMFFFYFIFFHFFHFSIGLILSLFVGIPVTFVVFLSSLFLLWQDKNCRQYLKNLLKIFLRRGNKS